MREAQGAESKGDFIHKMKISYKEAEETECWLLLCKYSENYPDLGKLLEDVNSLKRITGKIVASSKSSIPLKIGKALSLLIMLFLPAR